MSQVEMSPVPPAEVVTGRQTRSRATYHSLLDYLAVLPPSHIRFNDFSWQYAVYDLFHQKKPSQLSHALCMAPNVFTYFAFASLLAAGKSPFLNGGLALLLVLSVLYFWYDRLVGLVLLPVLGAMWLGATYLVMHWGSAALVNTAILASCLAFVQAAGHAPEPVPPPWSGCDQFVPVPQWLRTAPLHLIAGYGIMAVIGPVLEYWASPRLLPVQAMMILNRLGYRPGFRRKAAVKTQVFQSDILYCIRNEMPANPA